MLTPEQNFDRIAGVADWLNEPDIGAFDGDPVRGLFVERPALLPPDFAGYNVLMGRNSYYHCRMQAPSNLVIGRYCSINGHATLGAVSHPLGGLSTGLLDWESELGDEPPAELIRGESFYPTVIGCDVWIAVGAVVLQGVTIGHGACVGANAVVTGPVRPYAIMVGSPARELRRRFDDETCARLLRTRWWELPAEVVRTLPRSDVAAALDRVEAWRQGEGR